MALGGGAFCAWSIAHLRADIQRAELASNIATKVYETSETYGHLRALADGRIADTQEALYLKLDAQLSSLESALAGTDENTRDFGHHIMALMASHKDLPRGYYTNHTMTLPPGPAMSTDITSPKKT